MSEPRIITLGCRLNTFESEVIRDQIAAAGIINTVIVNTCAVTAESERQACQTIRRLRRESPDARIIVTGCAAQINPARFAAMKEVDRVVGNAGKLDAAILTGNGEAVVVTDIAEDIAAAGHLLGGFENRTRAFLQVQQGCDHRCTFCIVPMARGPNRSIAKSRIVEQARMLTANGHKEIVLTGADVSSYGADLKNRPALGGLARALLREVPDLKRLRISSLDPAGIDDSLFSLLADEPRFMPHLHLSLQSANDAVLKRMKRRHTRASAFDLCRRLRRARPDVALGADLIAGFPTESEDMFKDTLAAVEEMGLTYLHVFPYSPRPGTPAARMPQTPSAERKLRAERLRAAGDTALARFFEARVGSDARVLAEKDNCGHCEHFAPVRLAFDVEPGTIVDVRITGRVAGCLIGERAS
ncbi:MAG: tRNA (N(6)-L-threonylcarbamoyladenosine(37)-C(2))-methylthiotransferase MtaB [Rhodospirillales bacterium RIFCSPLOWO2_12_FULL_58_28]|nr:MAG: tRNA (N(6)-L-threonylcarbamoyladenosine(37)-C(2))-methylthiotransferase MtaB [Rhodospirillales bacterium RIFCSPLOWO2_02_FULL_58_16]OHC78091.1 MAG: tRNA (N(6)-L-threonylcarbamoyladenosine(37)-C(2))-methylthiotransferase MtaB [Rhodospirillales bacterium RIFCSPLOWO2_12_FULL_58_28]